MTEPARATDGTTDDQHAFSDGELTLVGRIPTASNATFVCHAGEAGVRVVYKPVRGEQPLWDFPDGTLADREVASYLISDTLGWGIIPQTILRDGPHGPGMVQRWISTVDNHTEVGHRVDLVDLVPQGVIPEGYLEVLRAVDQRGDAVSLVHTSDPRLQRMAVLDLVINNADRKGGHALEALDGQIYGVDHGICLHTEPKLRTVLWGWAGAPIHPDLLADLATLRKALNGSFADLLAQHLTDPEIESLNRRTQRVLDRPTMPLPNMARPIPWPAF